MTTQEMDKLWEEARKPLPSPSEVARLALIEGWKWYMDNKHLFQTGGDDHERPLR
ncbi:hypothetical protein ES702_04560 [subsurface metagenome]